MASVKGDEWTSHRGGPCPLPPQQKIIVRYRNDMVSEAIEARQRRWVAWGAEIGDSDWDIVAWKLDE